MIIRFLLRSQRDGRWITSDYWPYASATEDVMAAKMFKEEEQAVNYAYKRGNRKKAIDCEIVRVEFTIKET
jgi:hypothetical protein